MNFNLNFDFIADCTGILELHRRFVALYRSGQLKLDVFSFVETALTLMSVMYLRIVGIDSAGNVFFKLNSKRSFTETTFL